MTARPEIKLTNAHPAPALVVDASSVFSRPDFMEWLNSPSSLTATWHARAPGAAFTEYADVFVLVDTDYEGSDSDMPEDIWRAICDAVYQVYGSDLAGCGTQVTVRLTSL